MSGGRDKLTDFSLLKSLIGSNKTLKEKTDRLRHARKSAINKSSEQSKSVHEAENRPVRNRPAHSNNRNIRRNKDSQQVFGHVIRAPQFGQKLAAEELMIEAPATQEEDIIVTINPEKQRIKAEQQLFTWLCRRFPKCFNPKDKKPLKIGISDDIEVIYKNEFLVPVDKYILRNVLRRYVGDKRYQNAVLSHQKRYDLHGNIREEFSDQHIDHAKKRIDEISEKAYLRSQGIDIKTYYQQKREDEKKEAQLKKNQQQSTDEADTISSAETLDNNDNPSSDKP
ncbi:MAG: ProQ/FINO family protein [Francisellaceae bacterium]